MEKDWDMVFLRLYMGRGHDGGGEVATLVHSALSGGTHSVAFDADGLSTGYYLYKISAGNFTMSKKMLLVK